MSDMNDPLWTRREIVKNCTSFGFGLVGGISVLLFDRLADNYNWLEDENKIEAKFDPTVDPTILMLGSASPDESTPVAVAATPQNSPTSLPIPSSRNLKSSAIAITIKNVGDLPENEVEGIISFEVVFEKAVYVGDDIVALSEAIEDPVKYSISGSNLSLVQSVKMSLSENSIPEYRMNWTFSIPQMVVASYVTIFFNFFGATLQTATVSGDSDGVEFEDSWSSRNANTLRGE